MSGIEGALHNFVGRRAVRDNVRSSGGEMRAPSSTRSIIAVAAVAGITAVVMLTAQTRVVLRFGAVVDRDGQLRHDTAIVVAGDRIASVGPDASVPRGATTI